MSYQPSMLEREEWAGLCNEPQFVFVFVLLLALGTNFNQSGHDSPLPQTEVAAETWNWWVLFWLQPVFQNCYPDKHHESFLF